ncbi:MAG TPA: hypothetical protein VG734_24735 [Lacunisphaera sp.]|nr:hypothetical protein [Lacunisphaera sp.]
MGRGRPIHALLGLFLAITTAWASVAPGVAVVRTVPWVQADATRDGAAEMLVLLEVARLRQLGNPAGVVAVGDRRGLFHTGAEEALRLAVMRGVPVVKLAHGGQVLPAPHGLFLDGGQLSEAEAATLLVRCRDRHGVLPAATEGADLAELRARLQLYQSEFTLAASARLAAR